MREYTTEAQTLGCPSAPKNALVVMDEPDRPQPRLDRETDRGYAVSVGRIREDESGIFDLKFVALSHNSKSPLSLFSDRYKKNLLTSLVAVIGAAGSSILNAEICVLKGLA
jgi:aspartate-semialdehyde dehydrogenase